MKKIRFATLLFLLLCSLNKAAIAESSGSQYPTKTDTSPTERNYKNIARVNPDNLAMEMTLPIFSYPGRGATVPIELRYSSNIWRMHDLHTWFYFLQPQNRAYVTDVLASYGENTSAGWASSLRPPTLEEPEQKTYNALGQIYGDSVNITDLNESFNVALWTIAGENSAPEYTGSGCEGSCIQAMITSIGSDITGVICTRWVHRRCSSPYDDPDPNPSIPFGEENYLYHVKRLKVVMPSGSTTEFRQLSDQPPGADGAGYCGLFQNGCTVNYTGTFLAVDGSGMRIERGTTTKLLMPDGSFYTFSGSFPDAAESFTDINGNTMLYSDREDDYGWGGTLTDTLGREINDPLIHNLYTQVATVGTFDAEFPGLNGTTQNHQFTWKTLKPRGCETSTDPNCVGDAATVGGGLEDQSQKLYYSNRYMCSGSTDQDLGTSEVLFSRSQVGGVRGCNPIDILRDHKGDPVLDQNGMPTAVPVRFNPVVLTKVQLPNGESYQFAYNRFGEISKIIHPSGAYETFLYAEIADVSGSLTGVYHEANRGVTERRIYSSDNVLQQRWTYAAAYTGTAPAIKYKITTTASLASNPMAAGARSERYLYMSPVEDHRFGFSDPRVGRAEDEQTFDEANQLRSRVLTEYVVKEYQALSGGPVARRDVRVKRTATITFEPGSANALATMSETSYDENGSTDPELFSHLNAKTQTAYHYAAPTASAASNDSLTWSTISGWFTSIPKSSVSQTDFSYSTTYKARGIIGLPTEIRTLDPANSLNVLAKTQFVYDESAYFDSTTHTTTGWADPGSTLRGNPTTTKTWVKESDTWLDNHKTFDVFGNVLKVWGVNEGTTSNGGAPSTNLVETIYSADYKYAYPTTVISPAPDPSNTTGTSTTSTVATTYDLTTGLPLSVTDDFGQVTTTEYADALLRPTRVNPVVVSGSPTGPKTETEYDDVNRTVTVRKQLDSASWDEATTYTDSLGRTIKTVAKDSQGDVIVETHYDLLGRVDRVTNPYRAGETVLWSKTRYDAAGRAVETYAPETLANLGSALSLGTTSFNISTVSNFVGASVMTTDASLRKGRSITNALGQLLRVDEPTGVSTSADTDLGTIGSPAQATSYKYDAFGKMVQVTQGAQNRYFKYDALGRLVRARQPEQEVNTTSLNMSDSYNTTGQWTGGFAYDVRGNVVRATDANGVNIINEYDRANRVTKRCYTKPNISTTATSCSSIIGTSAESLDTPYVTFWYDGKGLTAQQSPNYGKGKLTKITSAISETRNPVFDNFGRLKETQQITDSQAYTSKFTYNLSGALIEEEYPSGRKVKNEFESDGDLKRIYGKASTSAPERTYANSFSYTPDGKIQQLKLGNGLWERAVFNARLQVTELALGHGVDSGDVWKLAYEYGELNTDGSVNANKNTGNIAKQTVSFSGLPQPFIQAFKYDPLYRLTEAQEKKNGTQTWIQQFGYDRYGNRTSTAQTINGTTINTTPAVDANTNRFTSTSYQFDKNGNLTQDIDPVTGQARTVVFNGDSKQSEVKNAGGTTIGRYYYDGEGHRVKKFVPATGETTIYVFSNGKQIAEYSTTAPPQYPTTNYTMTDLLGSPRVLTNSAGKVLSRRDFAPFGEEIFADTQNRSTGQHYSQSGDDAVRKRFTGYEKDMETGLDFAENRMYENRHGRFTAVDPLLASGKSANPQTFNRYVYVMNSPLILTDPSGLQAGSDSESDGIFMRIQTAICESFWCKLKSGFNQLARTLIGNAGPTDSEEDQYREKKRGGVDKQVGNAIKNYGNDINTVTDTVVAADPTGVLNAQKTVVNNSLGLASDDEAYSALASAALNSAATLYSPAKGVTVLGKFPHYLKFAEKIGANRFNIPNKVWNKLMTAGKAWDENVKFLDRAIARGDDIVLSSKVKDLSKVSGSLRKELDYLIERGFRLSEDGRRMIK